MACSEKSSEDCLECRRCLVLKYVRFGISKFLFSPLHVNHKDIQCVEEKPVSAGFINLTKMQTFGESYGLKLKPKKDDVELIKNIPERWKMTRLEAIEKIKNNTYQGEIIFLTKNFTFNELVKTEHREYVEKNFREGLFNESIYNNLNKLANKLLQPLREAICHPIQVNSGFRCAELNKAVGGSKNSQHLTGEAADIVIIKAMSIYEQFKLIYRTLIEKSIPYGQIIYEHRWIHISLPNESRKIVKQPPLEYKDGKYIPIKI